jgi:N-acylglucosamine-6-phosphate 2-epimerase
VEKGLRVLGRLSGGLIVSCQAEEGSPLHSPRFMAASARAAALGGAIGIRANGVADIRAIKRAVPLPIIGIYKRRFPGSAVYITPTFTAATAVVRAGAEIVALDGTSRRRPGGVELSCLLKRIKDELGVLVMADVSTCEEGIRAAAYGADLVSTTLAGYTSYSRQLEGPDLDLIEELALRLTVPLIAEGRITSPQQAREALARGAYAVVVGRAITAPQFITETFVGEMQKVRSC